MTDALALSPVCAGPRRSSDFAICEVDSTRARARVGEPLVNSRNFAQTHSRPRARGAELASTAQIEQSNERVGRAGAHIFRHFPTKKRAPTLAASRSPLGLPALATVGRAFVVRHSDHRALWVAVVPAVGSTPQGT